MSNLSYCRFENTDSDLDDCADDLERRIINDGCDEDGDPLEPLSEREQRAAVSLIMRCASIVEQVMEQRGLEDLDELSAHEIEAFLDRIQQDVETARHRRQLFEEAKARVGDYINDAGTLRRVVNVVVLGNPEVDELLLQYYTDDGRIFGDSDFSSDDVKLESEVRG